MSLRTRSAFGNTTFYEVLTANADEEPELADESPLDRVYFVLDRNACQIKIGFSSNVAQRVHDVAKRTGRNLDLIGVLPGGRRLERALHQRFKPFRVEPHEWYSSEIIAEVAQLLKSEPSQPRKKAPEKKTPAPIPDPRRHQPDRGREHDRKPAT